LSLNLANTEVQFLKISQHTPSQAESIAMAKDWVFTPMKLQSEPKMVFHPLINDQIQSKSVRIFIIINAIETKSSLLKSV